MEIISWSFSNKKWENLLNVEEDIIEIKKSN